VDDIYILRVLFDDVSSCVEFGLCDKATACQRFGKHMEFFLKFYEAYLSIQSRLIHYDLVKNMRTFADSCK
jgi:hypothetical protein